MKKKMNRFSSLAGSLLLLTLFLSGCEDPPLACFEVQTKIVDQNFPVVFTNCSQFQQAGYEWDFGDGNSSTQVSPTHKFAAQGEYLVSLTSLGNSSTNDDVFSDIIRVGTRALATINLTSLPSTNPAGGDWDAADGPDVKVMLQNVSTGVVALETPIQADVTLPATIVFQETSGNVNLSPEDWRFIVADDDAGSIDTMAVFSINLDTYEPNEGKTIALSDNATTMDIIYTVN